MIQLARLAAVALLAATSLAALPAFAADVALKGSPASHGASITLGDLFDGAGAAASMVVAPAAPGGADAVLDARRIQIAASRAGLTWDNAAGQRRIIVASLGGSRTPTAAADRSAAAAPALQRSATAGGRHASQALSYARNINAGELIAASDLVWSDEVVAPPDAPSDADAVMGKAARRPLRAGAAVGLHDLASPKVIKRDETVSVVFEDSGIVLALQARAMADAGVGDALNLMNLQSKKVLEAVCTGPGKAVVGPAAERMKVSAFDPGRFAAR